MALVAGLIAALVALALPASAAAGGEAPGENRGFEYDVPVQTGSPWPEMRRDRRNTGESPVRARYRRGDRPWSFRTSKGIFSTPVVDAKGTTYVGSADRAFYALDRRGRKLWRFRTGEVIDSAAVLGRGGTVTFGSGDERVYRLRKTARDLPRRKRLVWKFEASRPAQPGQLVRWFEGNVVIGPGGTLYAGNTGGGLYALTPGGEEEWYFPTANAVWSAVGIGDDGNLFFGSLDSFAYSVDPAGSPRWSTFGGAFLASSPAIGSDGTVHIGSFDGALYALEPDTGATRWTFATRDHVYSSPALEHDASGRTTAVYIASGDGALYKLTPSGELVWRYDTGDAIRSSPSLGRKPSGNGRIVYVGSSNGKLYAIDARTGRRRWSYDATPRAAVPRDRNDLNASPALSKRGIHIAGEHGRVVYVPYDYCLRRRDRRCETSGGEEFPDELTGFRYVTPGGNTAGAGARPTVPAATALTERLIVRRGGETLGAAIEPGPGGAAGVVDPDPGFPLAAEVSGDGQYLHVLPDGFLKPDRRYSLDLDGVWGADGTSGRFDDTVGFRTAPVRTRRLGLNASGRSVSALNLRRLGVPLPPLFPSVNQIGFDSYDWIVGAVEAPGKRARGGKLLVWIVGAKRAPRGALVADPASEFAFPMTGRVRNDSLILEASDITLTFTFGPVPLDLFQMRAQLDRRLRTRSGASMYAEVVCLDVPTYGPFLDLLGLCNPEGKLTSTGTFLTKGYRDGPANRRPRGVRVDSVTLDRPSDATDGEAEVRLELRGGARLRAARHVVHLLLEDPATGRPIGIDYAEATRTIRDGKDVSGARLVIPAGTGVPDPVRVHVLTDVYPLASVER